MTDKPIIVDGVNVSGCEYYFDEKCRCMDASIMQDFYSCPQCNNNPNCYYKQLQYKKQELTHFKKENDRLLQTIIKDQAEIVQKNIDETNILLMKENMDLQRQLDQLKAEHSLLKDEYKILEDNLDSRTRDFEDVIDEYTQTLVEIKELLLKTPTDSQEHCVNAKSVILQKISEVENELN